MSVLFDVQRSIAGNRNRGVKRGMLEKHRFPDFSSPSDAVCYDKIQKKHKGIKQIFLRNLNLPTKM